MREDYKLDLWTPHAGTPYYTLFSCKGFETDVKNIPIFQRGVDKQKQQNYKIL